MSSEKIIQEQHLQGDGHFTTEEQQTIIEAFTSPIIERSLNNKDTITAGFRVETNRRNFLKLLATATSGSFFASNPKDVEAHVASIDTLKDTSDIAINLQEIQMGTHAVMDKLGFAITNVETETGETKQLVMPGDQRIIHLLEDSFRESELLEGDELSSRILDDTIKLVELVQSTTEENGLSLSQDEIMDIVGTTIASWGIKNVLDKKIQGITSNDYLRMSTFTAVAYAVGDENRRTQLLHNLEETAVAVGTIGTITEVSDFIQLGKKDIVKQFMNIAANTPGINDEELSQFLANLQTEDPERFTRIVESIERYEQHTIKELLKEMNHEDADISGFIDAISSGKLSEMSRTEALRFLIVGSNTLGPIFTTLMSTSILTPICRSIARNDDGTLNPDIMSALQGYIPNNFGISGLGFIPGFYQTLNKGLGGIPIVKDAFLGADFGPRLAIKQKAGEHGLEAISQLDKANIFTQQGMVIGFGAEMAKLIAQAEGRPFAEVMKELSDPRNMIDTSKVFHSYGLTSNVRDAFFGRGKRIFDHLYKSFNNGHKPHEHAHEQVSGRLSTFIQNLRNSFADTRIGGNVTEGLKYARNTFVKLTDAHGWEHAVGPELTDILRTLPFQSLSVPFVEGVGKKLIEVFEDQVLEGLVENIDLRDEIVDFVACQAFGIMSTSFDNFAACKAGVTVLIDRIKAQVAAGLIPQEKIAQKVAGAIKKMYDSTVIDGGALPLGNMPNFKMFPLGLYSVAHAVKNLPRRLAPSLIAYIGDAIAQKFGILPDMKLEWFSDDSHTTGHSDKSQSRSILRRLRQYKPIIAK